MVLTFSLYNKYFIHRCRNMIRINFKIITFTTFIFLIGCESILNESSGISDAEMIQMIREADKVEVTIASMPSQSQFTIENDYNDYLGMGSWRASRLGYQVELAGQAHRSGKRNEVFFNLDGRKLNPDDWGRKDSYQNDSEKEDWRCFDIIFPLTFQMPDGSTITVESDDEDEWSPIKSLYDNNQFSEQKPAIQYPIVIFLDDESITVNDDEDLERAYGACYSARRAGYDRVRMRDCFEIVYPVVYTMPDGSIITVEANDEENWEILKSWYDYNPGYEEVRPELQYPIQLIYETTDGDSVVDVISDSAMLIAKSRCSEYWGDLYQQLCFEIVFPISFTMPDGSVLTIENDNGYIDIRNWYVGNDGYDDFEPQLQYPVEIIYRTEYEFLSFSIGSDIEMLEAKEECIVNEN